MFRSALDALDVLAQLHKAGITLHTSTWVNDQIEIMLASPFSNIL
jgi:hypothetical protein